MRLPRNYLRRDPSRQAWVKVPARKVSKLRSYKYFKEVKALLNADPAAVLSYLTDLWPTATRTGGAANSSQRIARYLTYVGVKSVLAEVKRAIEDARKQEGESGARHMRRFLDRIHLGWLPVEVSIGPGTLIREVATLGTTLPVRSPGRTIVTFSRFGRALGRLRPPSKHDVFSVTSEERALG